MSVAELLSTINRTSASIICSFLPTYIMGLIDSPLCRKWGHRRRPEPTFCGSVKLWRHSKHTYPGSFLLDPEDVRSLGLGTMWTFIKRSGLTWIGLQAYGHRGPAKGQHTSGLKGLESTMYLSSCSLPMCTCHFTFHCIFLGNADHWWKIFLWILAI